MAIKLRLFKIAAILIKEAMIIPPSGKDKISLTIKRKILKKFEKMVKKVENLFLDEVCGLNLTGEVLTDGV